MFQTIARVDDPAVARVLVAALRAHGFHPLEGREDGLPGLPGVIGLRGLPIDVPEDEAADAQMLANVLLRDMQG